MSQVTEAAGGSIGGQYAAALALGVNTISQDQTVTFTKYNRVILPLDGFAFWVRADQLSQSSVFNTTAFGAPPPLNTPTTVTTPATQATVKGSLHRTVTNAQNLDEGFSVSRVVFTSEAEIELLNSVDPKTLFLGEIDGQRFAFSKLNMLYRQGGLFHYQGDALYPSMATQVIDYPAQLDTRLVVSNSLPIWLSLKKFCPMYPSFLVADDIVPPYCSVHVYPESTGAVQSAPFLDPSTGSHYQLTQDRVLLTFFGLRNASILGFLDYVLDYAATGSRMGVMNSPVPQDQKRTQAELNILGQKKTLEFEVNYYQQATRTVALQIIREAFVSEFFASLDLAA